MDSQHDSWRRRSPKVVYVGILDKIGFLPRIMMILKTKL